MEAAAFERQVDRLARYFRRTPLTNEQKSEWYTVLGANDLADFATAVDAMIAEGRVGQLPTIAQAIAATAKQRTWRRERLDARVPAPEDFPATEGFQQDAKVNMLRLFGPVKNTRGKYLPQFQGDAAKCLSPAQQALMNLVALAERHAIDITSWPFLPDGDPARMKAYQVAHDHMLHPHALRAPSASELALLNHQWVDGVFAPTVKATIERRTGGA